MARTKQTARQSIGGKPLRRQFPAVEADADATRRKGTEVALMARLKRDLSPPYYKSIVTCIAALHDDSIDFETLEFNLMVDGCDDELRREIADFYRPGTDLYVYTTIGEPMRYRPGIKLDDFALEWDEPGDNFSTVCPICMGPFKAAIRTLECAHSFCDPCARRYLATTEIALDATGRRQVRCPSCKEVSWMEPTPSTRIEKCINSVLMTLQAKTLRYRCPCEGCAETFLRKDIEEHVEYCPYRKYVCDKGCHAILYEYMRHDDMEECMIHWREKAEVARKKDIETHELIRKKDNEIHELKQKVAGQSGGSLSRLEIEY